MLSLNLLNLQNCFIIASTKWLQYQQKKVLEKKKQPLLYNWHGGRIDQLAKQLQRADPPSGSYRCVPDKCKDRRNAEKPQ